MSKTKKIILFGIIGVVVIAIVYMNFVSNTEHTTKVNAEKAETRELVEQVSASGRIQPQTKVNITSEVTGEIIALKVKEGDYVNAGQMLIVLDTVQLKSNVDEARFAMTEIEARLEGSKVTMEQAKEEYERQERLFKDDLTSETAHNDAKYAYLNAVSSYDAMKAQAKQYSSRLEKQLDYLSKAKLVAPMSGIITYVDCEVGEIAPAQTAYTQGKTLMTISNLDVFEVEVEVDETEINKVELGQKVDIEVDAFADTVFPGQVVEIGNTALISSLSSQEQSTNFSVKVIFQETGVKIRPGMSATVDIITNKKENALSVPYSAIVMRSLDIDSLEQAKAGGMANAEVDTEDSETSSMVSSVQAAESDTKEVNDKSDEVKREDVKGVFVIRDGKARFVEVETGIADQQNIEVISGIEDGDVVVTGPYRVLRSLHHNDAVEKMNQEKNES